jgi:hypothetical protein
MRIIAVDPGGETGITEFNFAEQTPNNVALHFWNHREFKRKKHHNELYTYLSLREPDILLWEQFIDSPQEGVVETVSLEYIGVMELWLQERLNHSTTSFSYPPSKIKGFWTDDKLKRVGLYTSGSTHIRDTTRQVLTYLNDLRIYCYVTMLKA